MDTEFGLNFNLLKLYIVNVMSPDGLPNLSDHRVPLNMIYRIVLALESHVSIGCNCVADQSLE